MQLFRRTFFASGRASDLTPETTTLITTNEEMDDIMKIFKSPEESDLLIKYFSKTIKNELKQQKSRFFSMIFCTLGASLLGNLLTGKEVILAGEGAITLSRGRSTIRAGEETNRIGQNFHAASSFEIEKYYQNKPKFKGSYSRNNLTKIMHEAYLINLDEYKSKRTYWLALYLDGNNVWVSYNATYFDSFGVEHIPKEMQNL